MQLEAVVESFRRRFGRAPQAGARAPGRVNLIGEHTDYNEGLVLPCAIDRDTVTLVARRDDRSIRVHSRERDEVVEFAPAALRRRGTWLDYVQGVVFALGERGVEVPGLDVSVASEVPLESGLSSSASLCVSLATALDLGPESRILVFGTEGDTDPELYRSIVGRSAEAVRAAR